MTKWRERFFPQLPAEELERRLKLFHLLLLMQTVATIPLAVISILDSGQLWIMALCLAMILVAALGYWVARQGSLHLGVFFLLFTQLAFLTFFVAFYGTRGPIPIFFAWPIMVAAILAETPITLLTTALVTMLYGGLAALELYQVWTLPLFEPGFFAFWHQPDDPYTMQRFLTDTVDIIVAYWGVAFLVWIASRSLQQALKHSRNQRREMESYRAELEESMIKLHQTTEELQASLELVQRVGNPVLPIFEGILLVPLIGGLESQRARAVMDHILQETAKRRADVVIIDITGVSIVDTAVAGALIQTSFGIRLLGATPILVGIRAEVAETMVELGVDLGETITRASLQEGLEYALETMGIQILEEERTEPEGGLLSILQRMKGKN
jgi:anti-anti-sigma regulatory factor